MPAARDQLTAFLTALFKAVESTPNAVLVYTLAVGRDGKAQDAYAQENQFLAEKMAEAESVSARKATLLNPTEDDETVLVLRRRLFQSIDENVANQAVDAYRALWSAQRESIPDEALRPEIVDTFRRSYPFHPEVLDTLTGKTATLANFQRVRGMLRLLARTVGHLWEKDNQPSDATAIHVHHIDPGFSPIHQEFVTRLNLQIYNPAIRNDISGEGSRTALAQQIDSSFYRGMSPYASSPEMLTVLPYGASPRSVQYSIQFTDRYRDRSAPEDRRKEVQCRCGSPPELSASAKARDSFIYPKASGGWREPSVGASVVAIESDGARGIGEFWIMATIAFLSSTATTWLLR